MRGRVHPGIKLVFTVAAAASVGASQASLENLQDDIDEDEDRIRYSRALRISLNEETEASSGYAQLMHQRLAANDELPDHLKEPDLLPPTDERQGAYTPTLPSFDAFMAVDRDVVPAVSTVASGAQTDASSYSFSTRVNDQSKVEERTVDLSGHSEYCGLPIEDLAHQMALDSRGCLGIGSTGCGKSELLKQAIAAQHKIDSTTDFTVFAHKSGNNATGEEIDYAGMERSQDCCVFTASQRGDTLYRSAKKFERRLSVLNRLIEDGSAVPSVVVIDQANQGLKASSLASREEKRKLDILAQESEEKVNKSWWEFKALEEDYASFLETGMVDGRSKLVKLWSFGHSNTNKGTGLDHQIKENVFFIGLGRAGKYNSVENPLKDNRFIEDQDVRDRLRTQLRSYLKRHNHLGAPVNVVVAITNCGDRGWKLIVVPQYKPVTPISLGVTNPSQDPTPIPPDAKATQTELSLEEPPKPVNNQSISDFQRQLIASEGKQKYTKEQVEKTRSFAKWLKSHYSSEVDTQGLLDPQVTWSRFPDADSPTELEIILQLLSEQEAGEFITLPGTSYLMWRPGDRFKVKAPSQPQSKETLSIGLDRSILNEILKHLSQKQRGTLMTASSFLDSSRALRKNYGVTVAALTPVLQSLEEKGCIEFVGSDRRQFQFVGWQS